MNDMNLPEKIFYSKRSFTRSFFKQPNRIALGRKEIMEIKEACSMIWSNPLKEDGRETIDGLILIRVDAPTYFEILFTEES